MALAVPQTPYSADLGSGEPIATMRDATEHIRSIVSRWSPADFERSYAPGKWTARQILIHLVQTEIALGNRARMALSIPNYTAQAFDQDSWIAVEGGSSGSGANGATGELALAALVAMNAVNRALFESLTPDGRATPFSHPEYGSLTVDWLIHQMAGHLVHHEKQFDQIGAR